jgi:hypothetical protein
VDDLVQKGRDIERTVLSRAVTEHHGLSGFCGRIHFVGLVPIGKLKTFIHTGARGVFDGSGLEMATPVAIGQTSVRQPGRSRYTDLIV